jgi:hypothetical protein
MSQITNLDVSPYYDDFNAADNYHRVLFKPGYPVQARELTNLQSILQNQIERFGQHFFKEGAKVIPGNTAYTRDYHAVELNNTYQGVPIDAYVDQLIGTKITGQTTGVTANVDSVLLSSDSERGNTTLYVNYIAASNSDHTTQAFGNGEGISSDSQILSGLLGNQTIAAGEPLAITQATNASSTGSSFSIVNGVYFIRGQFVNVADETLVLDQYTNNPSYRIGLYINEEIITAEQDEELTDNATGYNNYAAPGADRLKVSTVLYKKALNDMNDENFVELAVVENGILRSKKETDNYTIINDELARRTNDESGSYYITPFDVKVKESLNDGRGNNGVYQEGQLTPGGTPAAEDLAVYSISPGKAYVRGYELETITTTNADCPKPRDTKRVKDESISYNTGSTLRLNRAFGTPLIGIGNTYVLSLRDSRVGTAQTTPAGNEIGLARVYDYKLDSGSYSSVLPDDNEWNISLYDVQTTTKITLNENVTLSTPVVVKGQNSGAVAYLKDNVSDVNVIDVYDKTGIFILNEEFEFNGISTNRRVATAITSYGIADVQSIHGNIGGVVGVGTTFSADVMQSLKFDVGIATISKVSPGGLSTITSTNPLFPGTGVGVEVGNLITYSSPNYSEPVYASVVSVGTTQVTITGVTTVSNIIQGRLPIARLDVTDLKVLQTSIEASSDNTLYTLLPQNNISTVDLDDSYITIRKSQTVSISSNQLGTPVAAGTNETFLPYDEERYSLIRSDGSTEVLTKDKFGFSGGAKELQIYNLGDDDSTAVLSYTLKKTKPTAKKKIKNRVNSIVIDKSKYVGSGIGATTLDDGLTYGAYPYGTRVQDSKISLNIPDIIRIHGIYESSDTTEPSSPKVVLSALSGPEGKTTDLLIGEKLTGQNSGAVAIVAQKLTDSQIAYIPTNQGEFREGEVVLFEESKIQGTVSSISIPSFDVSNQFIFNSGQRGTFYDYGYIKRKTEFDEPSNQLKIYFSNGYYDSSDNGDLTTANSYTESYNFAQDVRTVDGIRLTDIIDIRPKVSNYTVAADARSPFEFYGRTFNQSGNSASNILASDETLNFTYTFYLPRIDRIFLTKDGKFQICYGDSAENPERPVGVDNALEIATIELPPYLYHPSQASINFLEHKRYRMVDIKQLEKRIQNLEYYTSLTLLETNTANMFVPDTQGLNRFKSGFFVDNFSSVRAQENDLPYKNSVDIKGKTLKPQHYTNSIDLIQGPVVNVDPAVDLAFSAPEGINVRKTSDVVTLDYAEVEWLKQSFATRTESVTPFLVSFWQGTLELTPATDTWIDTTRLEAKIIEAEGNYKETMREMVETQNVDPQTGFAPTIWNAWETNWTGSDVINSTRTRIERSGARNGTFRGAGGSRGFRRTFWTQDNVIEETLREVRDTGVKSRTGTRTIVTEQWDNTSVGDRVVSRDAVPYMRSRNIQFVNKKVKPLARMYAFFDNVDVTKFCVPKLLEINMFEGVFDVGETVIGTPIISRPDHPEGAIPKITFRVAQSNHKAGEYNIPTETYKRNPYTGQLLSESYSSTSNILNVDTFSLQAQAQGQYFGWVESSMILKGSQSGAMAQITDHRLIADISANLSGSFFIPDPNVDINPRFEAGTKVLTFINDEANNQDSASSISEEGFTSSGTLETVQENIISVRNARIQNKLEFEEHAVARTTGVQVIASRTTGTNRRLVTQFWYDPLAQSFLVDDETGVFLTRCDLFFRTKDDGETPVTLQIRTMKGGTPTQKILPFGEVVLSPDDVNLSADGSVATPFVFDSPVYVNGSEEYAIAVASNSTKYSVYISRIGEVDLLTDAFISNQPYLGSLFKSQNASTWEPSQWEDLKFVLYRADFVDQGSIEFYNPVLSQGNGQVPKLMPDALSINSRKVRVALSTTINDPDITLGNVITQMGNNATANYVGTAGSVTGTLNVINIGVGYTGPFTYTGVAVTAITGSGRNATANIQVKIDGTVGFATILAGGSGYEKGDVLGVTTIGTNNLGSGLRLSAASIGSTSELILENVQGNFISVGSASTVQFINNVGVTTQLNWTNGGGGVQFNDLNVVNDGLHIKVHHKNHGMYDSSNLVTLSGVLPDAIPTKLSSAYNSTDTTPLAVENASNFQKFENVGVGTTNAGYLLIGDEIIGFTTATGSVIGGDVTRGSNPKDYPVGTLVYKYELDGISLRRINKTHSLSDATIANPIAFDSYHIKVGMTTDGVDRTTAAGWPVLYASKTKSTGGRNTHATQNMPYEIITPMVQTSTVPGTSLGALARTVSGKSISGNEIPFIDQGYDTITLNKANYLDSPRIICSEVNQDAKLTAMPGSKSFNLTVQLGSTDTRVSPVVDTQRVNVILTSSRVNDLIDDFALDNRVNSSTDDPSAFQYISKEINLENPATSLKIMLNANMNSYTDIRALYAISENQGFDPIFTLFPGYNNIDDRGQMINFQDSSGRSDKYVPIAQVDPGTEDWAEYTFTSSELPIFKSYRIKLILTSTSQVYIPAVKELRVLALA